MAECSCGTCGNKDAAVGYSGALTDAGVKLLKQAILTKGIYLGILTGAGAEVGYEGYKRMKVEWDNVDNGNVSRNINRLTPATFPVTTPPTMYSSLGVFTAETGGEMVMVINLMRDGRLLSMPLDKAFGLSIKSGMLGIDFARAYSNDGKMTATATCNTC